MQVILSLCLEEFQSSMSLLNINTDLHVQMVLFTNPSARAGYDTRSIFKRSLTGFEFRVFLLLD